MAIVRVNDIAKVQRRISSDENKRSLSSVDQI